MYCPASQEWQWRHGLFIKVSGIGTDLPKALKRDSIYNIDMLF